MKNQTNSYILVHCDDKGILKKRKKKKGTKQNKTKKKRDFQIIIEFLRKIKNKL